MVFEGFVSEVHLELGSVKEIVLVRKETADVGKDGEHYRHPPGSTKSPTTRPDLVVEMMVTVVVQDK